jgi:hypothetical protein
MVDSVLSAVYGEFSSGLTGLPVVPDAGAEGEESERDADGDTEDCASAVAFERELAFAGPEDGFDPLADLAERSEPWGFAFAVGASEVSVEAVDELFELFAGEPFVSQDGVSCEVKAVEHLLGCRTLTDVCGEQLKPDRHSVRGAQQVKAVSPEVTGVRGAIPVSAATGKVRAFDRFTRLSAGHRGRVEQPQVVSKRWGHFSEMGDAPGDLGGEGANAFVVPRLFGEIREQMPEAVAGERKELPVVWESEQHLADRERDEFAAGDSRWLPGAPAGGQEIIDLHVKCSGKGVKGGVHVASKVDVAIATPPFDARVMSPASAASTHPNTESTI